MRKKTLGASTVITFIKTMSNKKLITIGQANFEFAIEGEPSQITLKEALQQRTLKIVAKQNKYMNLRSVLML